MNIRKYIVKGSKELENKHYIEHFNITTAFLGDNICISHVVSKRANSTFEKKFLITGENEVEKDIIYAEKVEIDGKIFNALHNCAFNVIGKERKIFYIDNLPAIAIDEYQYPVNVEIATIYFNSEEAKSNFTAPCWLDEEITDNPELYEIKLRSSKFCNFNPY